MFYSFEDEQPQIAATELNIQNTSTEPKEKVSKIVTTEEELQAFYIVRTIAVEITDIKNIAYRDTESYFGILFNDNNRKPICRVNFANNYSLFPTCLSTDFSR